MPPESISLANELSAIVDDLRSKCAVCYRRNHPGGWIPCDYPVAASYLLLLRNGAGNDFGVMIVEPQIGDDVKQAILSSEF